MLDPSEKMLAAGVLTPQMLLGPIKKFSSKCGKIRVGTDEDISLKNYGIPHLSVELDSSLAL